MWFLCQSTEVTTFWACSKNWQPQTGQAPAASHLQLLHQVLQLQRCQQLLRSQGPSEKLQRVRLYPPAVAKVPNPCSQYARPESNPTTTSTTTNTKVESSGLALQQLRRKHQKTNGTINHQQQAEKGCTQQSSAGMVQQLLHRQQHTSHSSPTA